MLALALVGVMIYSATTGGLASLPATLTGIFITPVQSLTTALSDGVSGFFGQFVGSDDMRAQLAALEKENAALRQQVVELEKYKQENSWYSEILGLHEEHSDYTFAAGRVIGRDPSDPYGNFTIAAGTNASVAVNDPVITTDGSLVGVVKEVGLTYAKVRTVMDPTVKVASQISRTGDTAYTAGSTVEQARKNALRMTTLERSSGASIGDYVITSGIGGVYPAGLLLGTVSTITSATDGMTLNADVALLADIYDLKQVMVITSFDGQGGE
ncbi:MAG: rod shape-determining protein MreC [Clostridia bacterium]|nr:rod shape-determining protein MreC [Clostridia bacterium]